MTVVSEAWAPGEVATQIRAAQAAPCTMAFHELWYHAPYTWGMTRYKGVPMVKSPLDMQVYHEIIWQLQPALIIETGSCYGGSALWFADQLDAIGRGRVLSIDVENKRDPATCKNPANAWPEVQHDRIEWVVGSSTDGVVLASVYDAAEAARGPVLVSLDSDHRKAHVLAELDAYAPLVSPGSYLVVEDTNISGRPLKATDPGPGGALDDWLPNHPEFQPNAICERYILSMHPGGWLWRVP